MNQSQFAESERTNTYAGLFATEHDARAAVKELHKAGFRRTWLGKTREADAQTGEPTVETGSSVSRFFSGTPERRALHKVLAEHGLTERQAARIEDEVAVGIIILTVYCEDNPQRVEEIVTAAHGQIVGDGAALPTVVQTASDDPRTGVERDRRHDRDRETEREARDPSRYESVPTVSGEMEDVEAIDVEEFYGRGSTTRR